MTNKPEVKRYKLESGHDSVMRKVNRMQESEGGVYVRFDDYADLEQQNAELRSMLRQMISAWNHIKPHTQALYAAIEEVGQAQSDAWFMLQKMEVKP